MHIQLIEGEFSASDALDLITQMIHIKIKFHENKISKSENEEDAKSRESKIKRLQKDLYEMRQNINNLDTSVKIEASIELV